MPTTHESRPLSDLLNSLTVEGDMLLHISIVCSWLLNFHADLLYTPVHHMHGHRSTSFFKLFKTSVIHSFLESPEVISTTAHRNSDQNTADKTFSARRQMLELHAHIIFDVVHLKRRGFVFLSSGFATGLTDTATRVQGWTHTGREHRRLS